MHRLTKNILLILLSVFSLTARGQDYAFESWSVSDGLPQSQVWAMLEDSRGYLWMGTRGGGLCRFDGSNFTTFSNRDGLTNNFVRHIFEASDGSLWVGTDEGLNRYDGLSFTPFELPVKEDVMVSSMVEELSVGYWIGTSAGLFFSDGKTVERSEWPDLQAAITTLYLDQNQTLWVGTNNGLHRVEKDQLTSFGTNQGLSSRRIRSLTEDQAGNLWVCTYDGGVNIYDGHGFTLVNQNFGVKEGIINGVFSDQQGGIWLATLEHGVARWFPQEGKFRYLNEEDGLCNNHVRYVLHDSWGNFWFGTSGGGISRYYPQRFGHFGANDGLTGDYIYSVHFDTQGALWTGTSGMGVTRYRDGQFEHFGAAEGFLDEKVKTIAEDAWGRMWFGTEGEGLGLYDGEHFQLISGSDGLSDTWVKDICSARDSSIWVATAGWGITRMTPTDSAGGGFSFEYYNKENVMPVRRVTALSEDTLGRMWFGTGGGGIGFIENGKATLFTEEHGLADNHVRDLVEDDEGYLWITTRGNALNRIRLYGESYVIESLSHDDGLTSTNVYGLAFDSEGTMWVGTESGLDKVEFAEGRKVERVRHYGQAEGMRGIELAGGAVTVDAKGNLWLGTISSLELFDPSLNQKNEQPPRLSITGISLFYNQLAKTDYKEHLGPWHELRDNPLFAFSDNHLTFDFIGVDHRNPVKVRYRWQLENFEEDWSPVSDRHSAIYSNIPPGEYTFVVQAANEDMVWSEARRLPFRIAQPFWQTWWFITLVVVSGALLVIIVFMSRVRQIKKKAARAQERLSLEKDLIRLEQKALRLQMNPHFIFNALNSIQGLIASQDAKTARYYLAKFSRLMRLILENSRSPMISLEDEVSTLENYLSLEQFSAGEHFDYQIQVDEALDVEFTGIPPMMIQPFVENAIIHGIKQLEGRGGKIIIRFQPEGKTLRCSVQDNGIGRARASEMKAQKSNYHKSTALVVTQERLDILNAGLDNAKGLEIIDLTNDQGQPSGTEVVLRIPLVTELD